MAFYHRSSYHKSRESEQINLRSKGLQEESHKQWEDKETIPKKGKEEASERMLTEKEASQLSDTDFNARVIRKLSELSELTETNQKLQGKYNELTANYINRKRK